MPLQLAAHYNSYVNTRLLLFHSPIVPIAIREPVLEGLLTGPQRTAQTELLSDAGIPLIVSPLLYHSYTIVIVSTGLCCKTEAGFSLNVEYPP